MAVRLKPVSDQVIVITGASSGIGLATAQLAARQGARVVLAARTGEALDQAVRDIEAGGGTAAAVVADVGDAAQVRHVADEAIRRFGRIDTWVNNAGVGIWGRIEAVPEADMRRLFDTNFWGVVHGSMAALPYLKAGGGALITTGSMVSERAAPLQGIYSASKQAVKGFTEALRVELEKAGAPVSVTLVKPAAIGTPLPQHVRNYTGHEAKLPPPVYDPADVARVILHAASHPVREAYVGGAARALSVLSMLSPRLTDLVSEAVLFRAQLGPNPPDPRDNLWQAGAQGQVRGERQRGRHSLYSTVVMSPKLAALAGGLVLLGVARLLPRPGRGR